MPVAAWIYARLMTSFRQFSSSAAARRYCTDKAGYAECWPRRARSRTAFARWALQRHRPHFAHRLSITRIVSDVPPKLSAQVRVFATGNGRKTDPLTRTPSRSLPCALRAWSRSAPEDLVVMGMLACRRDELGQARTQVACLPHPLLLELLPGGAGKFLSARQARALIATVKPRDLAGKTRPRLAVELRELEAIDKKTRALDKELTGSSPPAGPP